MFSGLHRPCLPGPRWSRGALALLLAALAAPAASAEPLQSSEFVPRGQTPEPADLEDAAAEAVNRGVSFLLSEQELDGSWRAGQELHRNAQTARSVHTLLRCGMPAHHQSIRRALAFLRAVPPRAVTSLSLQILALAELRDDEDLEDLRSLTEALLDRQRGGFADSESEVDLSSTRDAALALNAARSRGIPIPERVWKDLAEWVLLHHDEEGTGFFDRAGSDPTGSTTAAALTALAICETHLKQDGRRGAEIARARERAFDGLAAGFEPSGFREGVRRHVYLAEIERACTLAGRPERLGSHDWYTEGARKLIASQASNGSWNVERGAAQRETCLALSFLARASGAGSPRRTRGEERYRQAVGGARVVLNAAGDTPLTMWIDSFGEQVLRDCEWPGEAGLGPRVKKVEYVVPGGVLVADGRQGGVEWQFTSRDPDQGWTAPDFDDSSWQTGLAGFGDLERASLDVRTDWKGGELWLRRSFDLAPESVFDPRLVLRFPMPSDARQETPGGPPLVCLFDEDESFPGLLGDREGVSSLEVYEGEAHLGVSSLLVTPSVTHEAVVPGWTFRIRRKPRAGEYRYVRFAWRKEGGDGIMLQFADGGNWGERTVRYFAGRNELGFGPAIQVGRSLPKRWTVVTRDLYADFGGEALLTGIALTPMSGEYGLFDSIWLARHRSDFADVPENGVLGGAEEDESDGAPGGGDAVVVYLNGRVVYSGGPTAGYEPVVGGKDLREALVPGRNVLAVALRGAGEGTAFDLGLADHRVIASVPGDPRVPAEGERFEAEHRFERPGPQRITARVHALLPVSGELVVLDSRPLDVRIEDALDGDLLAYAADTGLDLLDGGACRVEASSELPGWPAERAVDGLAGLAWLCGPVDRSPTLKIELDRPVRADTLHLTHARADRADPAWTSRAVRVEVRLNGRGGWDVVEMVPDDMLKTTVYFASPVTVRTIELRILDRTRSDLVTPPVGLAEVELRLR